MVAIKMTQMVGAVTQPLHPCLNPELLRSTLAQMPSFSSVRTLMFVLWQPVLVVEFTLSKAFVKVLKVTCKGCVFITMWFLQALCLIWTGR